MTKMSSFEAISAELWSLRGTKEDIRILSSFFKIGKGQYGQGDRFLGIRVPIQRRIAKKYFRACSFLDIGKLLDSKWHEFRLVGLFLLLYRFAVASEEEREIIYRFYIDHFDCVNNWDLVDASASHIVGEYMISHPKEKKYLKQWAKSKRMWDRRIALVSTHAFVRRGSFEETLVLSTLLLEDPHDLIQKASGWMLREIGKKNKDVLYDFLEKYATSLPRVTLRYAIERFDLYKKHYFLRKKYEM